MKLHQAVAAAFLVLFVPFFAALLVAAPASAASGDAKATRQIDDAINTNYASADIDLAEKKLLDVIKNCATACSPSVVARAWMYVGIVRGSGRDDSAGAQAAFASAKAADPNVKLDDLFATDLVKKVFALTTPGGAGAAAAGGPTAAGAPMPLMDDIKNRAQQPPEVTAITCSLKPGEVETQRPIPLVCRAAAGTDSIVLSYKHEGTTRWHELKLTKQNGAFLGEIPCTDTAQIGVLAYRLRAFDSKAQQVDALGTEQDPLEVNLVDTTTAPPPSLPGQPAPASCRPKKVELPTGPKLGTYGDACTTNNQCQGGLSCISGKCSSDVHCESDSECFAGTCVDNVCVANRDDCEGAECTKQSRVSKNWFGIQGGVDFAMMSGSQVCGENADVSFSCFEGGSPYRGLPNQNFAGNIDSGFRTATARVMLSYERALGSILSLEGRLGFAFNGGPESPKNEGGDGSKFLPFHAEARLKLYFTKVYRDDGNGLKGPSGFVLLGGGVEQVDPHVSVPVAECRQSGLDTPFVPGQPTQITQAEENCIQSSNRALSVKDVDVYQRLGQGFVTAGVGLRYGFGRHMAAILSVTGEVLLPSVGLTLSPTLGVLAGF
ncbi:MAG TPA: EB domain-containing protein [Polyangiaceae bacterium]|nr:EB domain-containing protein [Polyangiaceae bacterium]